MIRALVVLAATVVLLALMAACGREQPRAWPPTPLKHGTTCEPVWVQSDHMEVMKCWPA